MRDLIYVLRAPEVKPPVQLGPVRSYSDTFCSGLLRRSWHWLDALCHVTIPRGEPAIHPNMSA